MRSQPIPGAGAPTTPQEVTPSGATGLGGGKGGSSVKNPKYPGNLVDGRSFDSNSVDFLFGVAGTTSLILDLDEAKRFYLEAWARYHWMSNLGIGNGSGSTTVDLSSLEAGFGLGVRF